MRTHSLIKRAVLVVLLVELLCGACLSGLALWHEWRVRVLAIDALLQGRSDSLLGAVQDAEDPADNVFVDPAELKLPKEDYFSVFNQDGKILGGNERNAFPLTERVGTGFRFVTLNGRSYRVIEKQALRIIDRPETGGIGIRRPVTIVYAIPISTAHIWHEIRRAAGFYIAASLVFATITAAVLLALLSKLLRPIAELAEAAENVSPASLTFTPPSSAVRTKELQPLIAALSSTIASLKEAFEKQHRFVSDAAHELKTAVAVVRSTIQVLNLRPRTVGEYRAGLDSVLADNERVEELVARMLLLARVEEGTRPAQEQTNLALSVKQALQELESYATVRGVALQTPPFAMLTVRIAAADLRTVVTNLAVNAIQHSNTSSTVSIRVYGQAEPVEAAVLEVEDQGEGIAANDLPFVFDRFYRTDTSRSRATGGAGLGLAICKKIIEAAGGQIDIESAVGRGTLVRVSLPLCNASDPHALVEVTQ